MNCWHVSVYILIHFDWYRILWTGRKHCRRVVESWKPVNVAGGLLPSREGGVVLHGPGALCPSATRWRCWNAVAAPRDLPVQNPPGKRPESHRVAASSRDFGRGPTQSEERRLLSENTWWHVSLLLIFFLWLKKFRAWVRQWPFIPRLFLSSSTSGHNFIVIIMSPTYSYNLKPAGCFCTLLIWYKFQLQVSLI